MVASKMKQDIALVRDQWQHLLSEKELELKKQEASESLRLKNQRADITLQHQTKLREIEGSHNDVIARLETDSEALKQDYESRLAKMIDIAEHEQILNVVLGKASIEASQKVEQIQATMEDLMQKQLYERITDCQKHNEQAMIHSHQSQTDRHAKEKWDADAAHEATISELRQAFGLKECDMDQTIELLSAKLDKAQNEQ